MPALMECLASLGPTTGRILAEALGMDRRDISKLCRRAEDRRLIVKAETTPRIYEVMPGWEERLRNRDWGSAPTTGMRTPAVNSVWSLGA